MTLEQELTGFAGTLKEDHESFEEVITRLWEIVPGKVNPVIPEAVNQVAFVVAGADVTLTMAAEAGQLQLNAFGPVVAHTLFESLQ